MEEILSGADALVGKIIDDAKAEALKLASDADGYYEQTVAAAEKAAAEYSAAAAQEAQKSGEELLARRRTLSLIEKRKILLEARQSLVGKVFVRVENKLKNMGKEDYLCLVGALVKTYAEKGEKVVIDKSAPCTEEEVAALAEVKKLGLSAEKSGDFGGGIMLSGEKADKDLSFSAIVAEQREKCEAEVAARLFGD